MGTLSPYLALAGLALSPILLVAALLLCAGWFVALWLWLPLRPWPKAIAAVGTFCSWLAAVLLSQGTLSALGYPAILVLVAAPAALGVGLLARWVFRGNTRWAAGACIVTYLAIGFGETRMAIEDGLFHKRSMQTRSFAIRAVDGSEFVLSLPRAYLESWDARTTGRAEDWEDAIRIHADARDFKPWADDLWQHFGTAKAPDPRFRLRIGISRASSCPSRPEVDGNAIARGYLSLRCQYEWATAFRFAATEAGEAWFTKCTPVRTCSRWPSDPNRPVVYVYEFGEAESLDLEAIDRAVVALLRSFGMPIVQ